FLFNWRYVIFYFLPFWYLGHCFSYLNGYYRHYGANPDKPIAWGVSSYGKIYNWLFFYNGYHAEHHFRPKVHWTKMEKFRQSLANLIFQEKLFLGDLCSVHGIDFRDFFLLVLSERERQRRFLQPFHRQFVS